MYSLKDYNVVWDTPGKDCADSMPTGNGDIGINVWTDKKGDVMLYLGKTDSWDENGRLLKVGRLRLHFEKSPFLKPKNFRQELSLAESAVFLSTDEIKMKIWVDANRSSVHIEADCRKEQDITASLEIWRDKPHELLLEDKRDKRTSGSSEGSHSEAGLVHAGLRPMISADTVVNDESSIIWYHRNETSIWKGELEHQGLGGFTEIARDPLLHVTSGGMITAQGFAKINSTTLHREKTSNFSICAVLLTAQTDTAGEWVEKIKKLSSDILQVSIDDAYSQHVEFWKKFWDKSYIKLSAKGKDAKEAETITRMWHLQRYTIACAARGAFPLKFNGSIFNVDGQHNVKNTYCSQDYSADFRAWGGCYWFQNQRQIYWAMLASGDFDCMLPFFKMYFNALDFAKYMTKTWFGHDGAFFPETMYFWGSYNREDYGLTPAGGKKEPADVESGFVKRYWQGGLELSLMMIEYYRYTHDEKTFTDMLYPVIKAVLTFYDLHYNTGNDGKMIIAPAQSLETYWNVKNPLPEIAGLKTILEELDEIGTELLSKDDLEWLNTLYEKVPELTVRKEKGVRILQCCESGEMKANNMENVSMYAVFPYQRYGLLRPDLKMARDTFAHRKFDKYYSCWHNNNVFAAYLGLEKEARKNLAKRYCLHDGYRFTTFYVQGDWVPDHDNGSVAQQTVQAMLMQSYKNTIMLFPAFPQNWDAEFKLHTSGAATVEAVRVDSKMEKLNVSDSERMKDIKNMDALDEFENEYTVQNEKKRGSAAANTALGASLALLVVLAVLWCCAGFLSLPVQYLKYSFAAAVVFLIASLFLKYLLPNNSNK